MTRLILTRLAQLPLVLLAVYTLTLALAWAIPGNFPPFAGITESPGNSKIFVRSQIP